MIICKKKKMNMSKVKTFTNNKEAAVAASLFTNSSLKSNSNYKHSLCKLTNNKEVYEVGEGGGHASAGAHSYSSANEKDDGLLRGGLSKHYQILVSNR